MDSLQMKYRIYMEDFYVGDGGERIGVDGGRKKEGNTKNERK